jgi:glycosyltransferase involved in cell wall biosynthesis
VTEETPYFDYENVTQIPISLPSYPNSMRIHFDFFDQLSNVVKPAYDIDVVFSHLPEHTLQLKNLLYNSTKHRPEFFGYCHWFEFEEVTNYEEDVFFQNILGLLEMDTCYVNTKSQKELVLQEASDLLNEFRLSDLDDILEPLHLGVDSYDISESINETPDKRIVFNHRADNYKNFDYFLDLCEKLYERRQDFTVWVPFLDGQDTDYQWLETDYLDTADEYHERLRNSCFGYAPRQVYRGWSISTTDGLMSGCPFVMFDGGYYRELWPDADFVTGAEQTLDMFEKYLDNPEYRNKKARQAIDYCENNLLWSTRIDRLSGKIDSMYNQVDHMSDNSDALYKIHDKIQDEGSMSKTEILDWLNWGQQIPWTPYRKALLEFGDIFDSKCAVPVYQYKE